MTGRNAVGTPILALIVVVIVLIAGTGLLVFSSQPTSTTTTQSSSPTVQSSAAVTSAVTTSSVNASGLRLTLSASRSTIQQGSSLSSAFSLFNTLSSPLNLSVPPKPYSLSLEPCSQLPFGIGVLRGEYNADQISEQTLLNMSLETYYPGGYSCGATFIPASWTFAPQSDNVTLNAYQPSSNGNGSFVPTVMWTKPGATVGEYWGYWTGAASEDYGSGNAVFHSFEVGNYTLAAVDAWGQSTVVHFQVVALTGIPLNCDTVPTNSSFVPQTDASSGSGPLNVDAYYRGTGSDNATYLIALSTVGTSPVSLVDVALPDTNSNQFSPNPGQVQTWAYLDSNGTSSYPGVFEPGQCSLVRVVLVQSPSSFALTLTFSDDQTQTIVLNPWTTTESA